MTEEEIKVLTRAGSPGGIDTGRLIFCADALDIARDLQASGLLQLIGYTYTLTEIGRICLREACTEHRPISR